MKNSTLLQTQLNKLLELRMFPGHMFKSWQKKVFIQNIESQNYFFWKRLQKEGLYLLLDLEVVFTQLCACFFNLFRDLLFLTGTNSNITIINTHLKNFTVFQSKILVTTKVKVHV